MAPLLTVGTFALILGGFVWLGRRMRDHGISGSPMGPFEEMWDPGTHRAHQEIQIQHERKAEAPSPGDPLLEEGGYVGPN